MANLNTVALLVLVTIAAIAQIRANEKKLCPAKFRAVSSTSSFCITGKKYKVGEKRGVSDADKKIIVDTHNRLRGSVNPAPKMMLKMHWDDETARLAQNLADRCLLLQHDENMERMVPGKFSTGQNLAYGSLDWASAVQDWYDEITGFDWKTGKSKPSMEAGHFTQVVWATSAAIGCGFAMCEFDGKAGPNYVCNYGPPGNEPNKFEKEDRPYLRGTRGEDCGDSYDPKTGLCDCGGKICLNGGVLEPKSCKCSCKYLGRTIPWVSGDNCQLDCTKNVKDMPGGSCAPYDCKTTAIYDMCPVYCNLCPSDGIKYANGILADSSLPRGTGTICDFACFRKWTWDEMSSTNSVRGDFRFIFAISILILLTLYL